MRLLGKYLLEGQWAGKGSALGRRQIPRGAQGVLPYMSVHHRERQRRGLSAGSLEQEKIIDNFQMSMGRAALPPAGNALKAENLFRVAIPHRASVEGRSNKKKKKKEKKKKKKKKKKKNKKKKKTQKTPSYLVLERAANTDVQF